MLALKFFQLLLELSGVAFLFLQLRLGLGSGGLGGSELIAPLCAEAGNFGGVVFVAGLGLVKF